jgi:nicotinate dehydrogenase subunit A
MLDVTWRKGEICQKASRPKEAAMPQTYRLNVNGSQSEVTVEGDTPLLYVLRNDLELSGPKFGCGLSQCGSCTVLLEGQPIRSCRTPVSAAGDREITTLEGIGTEDHPHPLQTAFITEQAMQCGYCINGMIMSAKALLDKTPRPTDGEVRQALAGNLCRCGSHNRIVKAILRASRETRR